MQSKNTRLRYACFCGCATMSVVANLSPILFLTFRAQYGISYSLLGLLILINYMTQLGVDLIFSAFSHKIDPHKAVKATPYFMIVGLLLFAAAPTLFPGNVFIGLAIATTIFSAAGGLGEVLISPLFAALPTKDPDREMSKLHSVYAWGTVFVVIFSTVFLNFFGAQCWQILSLIMLIFPLASICLLWGAKLPDMQHHNEDKSNRNIFKNKWLWLCSLAIFLGGASECTMAQWSSGYLEQALGIPKMWGDMFGVALFAAMLGLGRSLYAKYGKNILKILLLGTTGAFLCYLYAALTGNPVAGLVACAFTGFCTSMLWPGNLVVAADRFPASGVVLYAFMAAAGDMGASVGPQLVGVITDMTVASLKAADIAAQLGLTPDQLGMKLGMFAGLFFPLAAIPLYIYFIRSRKSNPDTF